MDSSQKRDDNGSYQDRDIIFGKNAVKEALKSGKAIDYVMIERGEAKTSLAPIIAVCREKGIIVKEVDSKKLEFLCAHENHQGVALFKAAHEYSSIAEILSLAKDRSEPPFVVICDALEDPHNLGAIIRTAEACGVHGVIIPQRRSATLSGIVSKTSAGAFEYMKVAKVVNLNSAIAELKENGLWIYAADMEGTPYNKVNFSGPVALIIGSEGKGVSRLVLENSDMAVSLPMKGQINSLNASVAAGILMFEIAKTR